MPITLGERRTVEAAVSQGAYHHAATLLGGMLRGAPTASDAAFVASRFEQLAAHLALTRTRIFVLRSFTFEPVIPFLRARCYAAGIDAAVTAGAFNAYAQELLDPDSALYRFDPNVAVLAVRAADLVPELWETFVDHSAPVIASVVDRAIEVYAGWFATFRARSTAALLVHTLEQPASPAGGVLDDQEPHGQKAMIARINRGIGDEAARHRGVHVLDYDAVVARHGRFHWHDERRWRTLRMPLAVDALDELAREYMRFLHPITGRICKVLALDLDNTLWRGIVGEDGPSGIRMDAEYGGCAHRALQRAALDLKRRGIMLAVCSRNNPEDAMDVLRTHRDMLLRPEDFAAIRLGWEDKDEMLRSIAGELNIGTDALAFFDDSPRERDLVRTRLPDVHVLDVPDDPMAYADALRNAPIFERLTLAAEDLRRDELVTGEQRRTTLRGRAGSLEEFYRSLDMVAEVGFADDRTTPRIAQLTQKTSQFNLTTRRYTEADVALMAGNPSIRVFWLRLTDRFGDSGIVGVAIMRMVAHAGEIDTFLLSCRVIGRTVETVLLAAVAAEARAAGATRLLGTFIPTAKNAPAREFFATHRFTTSRDDGVATSWELDLSGTSIEGPSWIRCEGASTYAPHVDRHR